MQRPHNLASGDCQVKSVFDETDILLQLAPDLRISILAAIHGPVTLLRLPAICSLEASQRGAVSLIMPRLRPYCFSKVRCKPPRRTKTLALMSLVYWERNMVRMPTLLGLF